MITLLLQNANDYKITGYKNLHAHFQVWDNFFATESPLKIIKNAFYFTLKEFSLDFFVV